MIGPLALIVTAAALKNSSDVFNILDGDSGGAKTFSVQLSPNGQSNATHWACYTYLDWDVHDALANMSITEFKAFVDTKAAERGRTPVGSVTAFKNSLQISEQGANFWQFVADAGLQVVEQPEVTP